MITSNIGEIIATLDSNKTEGASTDFTEGEEGVAQVAHGAEEECSDDEMVFEAYVSPFDAVNDSDDLLLDDEDMKVSLAVYYSIALIPRPVYLKFFPHFL